MLIVLINNSNMKYIGIFLNVFQKEMYQQYDCLEHSQSLSLRLWHIVYQAQKKQPKGMDGELNPDPDLLHYRKD